MDVIRYYLLCNAVVKMCPSLHAESLGWDDQYTYIILCRGRMKKM